MPWVPLLYKVTVKFGEKLKEEKINFQWLFNRKEIEHQVTKHEIHADVSKLAVFGNNCQLIEKHFTGELSLWELAISNKPLKQPTK